MLNVDDCASGKYNCWRGEGEAGELSACVDTFRGFVCRCPQGAFRAVRSPSAAAAVSHTGQAVSQQAAASSKCCSSLHQLPRHPNLHSFCLPCPAAAGYEGDGQHCADIDECKLHIDGCDQICINTPGSYRCDCRSGYTLVRGGGAAGRSARCWCRLLAAATNLLIALLPGPTAPICCYPHHHFLPA